MVNANDSSKFSEMAEIALENGASLADLYLAANAMFGTYSANEAESDSEVVGTIPA